MSDQSRYKFLLFIIVTSTIGQIAAEIYIPSLPYISHDFLISNSLTQLSIAVFLFGMAVPGIFFGYISDYFGRRKILILSTSISSVGTLMCVVAPNIYVLIIGRLIQGLGFSGVGSLSRAILRDRMSGVELAKFASNLAVITVLVIDVSPFFGGFLQQYFGWRPIFAILLCYNLFAIYISYQFKDDSSAELNEQLNLGRILHSAYDVIKDKTFFKYNMFSALTYAVLMSYLAVASFLFENKIGISPTEFGTTTLGLSFVYMLGTFTNGRLLRHFHMDQLIRNGVVLMWVTALYCLLIATLIPLSYWSLVILVVLIYLSSSALFANSSAQAFSSVGKSVGVASALYSSVQVFVAAVFSALISLFHVHSTLPLAGIMLILCVLMTGLFAIKIKR
ncbi:MAG: Bcr/CflA family efflux MFS transporter [Neisseriaceae bacterium]|nr:MAG: Bcr/CflA family efflux MFS transporter [Neisseriaceae bacterium]